MLADHDLSNERSLSIDGSRNEPFTQPTHAHAVSADIRVTCCFGVHRLHLSTTHLRCTAAGS